MRRAGARYGSTEPGQLGRVLRHRRDGGGGGNFFACKAGIKEKGKEQSIHESIILNIALLKPQDRVSGRYKTRQHLTGLRVKY